MTSLVIQTSFLGDVVLTTPLIAALASRGPVDVLTTKPGALLLANNPGIRNTIVYEKREADRGVGGFTRTVRRLRSSDTRYETVYLAQGSLRSAAIALAAGIRQRVGFDTSAGKPLYTDRVPYAPQKHHAERLWSLAYSDCADPPTREQIMPKLYPGDRDRSGADDFLAKSGIDDFIAIAPGSAWGTKRWPFYPELATKIAERSQVVVVGGNADREAGNLIVAQLPPGRGANAAGSTSLLTSVELIRRARAIVSNDSASQHFASAMGTPTITIFGPTVPAFGFGPLAPKSSTMGIDYLDCRPCDRHGPMRCPLGHWRCMRELSSIAVYDELMRITTST